mmetsp:Transcript_28308/g.55674  ORF Transcript_28308/g.55674 Transcript_28308/m.55674 type:complete len:244 (+) Transcript_28308:594-1325(+)
MLALAASSLLTTGRLPFSDAIISAVAHLLVVLLTSAFALSKSSMASCPRCSLQKLLTTTRAEAPSASRLASMSALHSSRYFITGKCVCPTAAVKGMDLREGLRCALCLISNLHMGRLPACDAKNRGPTPSASLMSLTQHPALINRVARAELPLWLFSATTQSRDIPSRLYCTLALASMRVATADWCTLWHSRNRGLLPPLSTVLGSALDCTSVLMTARILDCVPTPNLLEIRESHAAARGEHP